MSKEPRFSQLDRLAAYADAEGWVNRYERPSGVRWTRTKQGPHNIKSGRTIPVDEYLADETSDD